MFRILLCDDEAVIRAGLRKLLEETCDGIEVHEARDGVQGYALFQTLDPQCVITDIRMPVMDGLALVERLAAQGASGRCVILSAYSDFSFAQRALRLGAADYLVKPINHLELLKLLETQFGLIPRQSKPAPAPAAENQGPVAEDQGPVANAISYIEHHFYENISLESVSRHIHVNPTYLSTLFKKQTGMRYIEYLTRLRLSKADHLIRHTDLRIHVISEMVGYSAVKHFAKLYREAYGMSPTEARGGAAPPSPC